MSDDAQPQQPASYDVHELSKLVLSGLKTYEALAQAKADDGKIDLNDLPKFVPLLAIYADAIPDIGQTLPEIKDLSAEEAQQLVALVAAELGASVDAALQNKIEKVLAALVADYEAVKAFL